MKSPRKLLAGIAALALLDIEEEYDAKRWEVILQNYHDDPNPTHLGVSGGSWMWE